MLVVVVVVVVVVKMSEHRSKDLCVTDLDNNVSGLVSLKTLTTSTPGTNVNFPIIQNLLVLPKFIQSVLKCIHSVSTNSKF